MAEFELVVFDCDGVVVDSEVLACTALAGVLGRHGMPVAPEEVSARYLGRSTGFVLEDYRRRLGRGLPATFLAELQDAIAAAFRAGLTPIAGVEPVLAGLAVPYCLASSSSRPRIDLALAVTGLSAYFGDRIYDAAMVAHAKPAPDLFLHAAKAMGKAPARTLVIEDSVSGVAAGKAAGMTVWGFVGGSHCVAATEARLREAGADRIFSRMADFGTLQESTA
jgi:HAD superfamily hydrolase (TIGR01509 family)